MTMGREKSDGSILPKGRRKTAAPRERIGKGTTANKQTGQLELLGGPAASLGPARVPRVDVESAGRSRSSRTPMPPPSSAQSTVQSAMTMEAVANEMNLRRAFERVADNDGAAGVDRKSVAEVARHLDAVIIGLHQTLRDGTYQPGLVRRVCPSSGVGRRAAADSEALASRMSSTASCNRLCTRCSVRTSSRRSMTEATVFARTAVATRRLHEPARFFSKALSTSWTSIWRSSSIGSTTIA